MKCTCCNRENPDDTQVCQYCGTALMSGKMPRKEEISRLPPGTEYPADLIFQLCPRCGHPAPDSAAVCPHCRWTLRKPFKAPSNFTCGSCLWTVIIRFFGFLLASGISFVVGVFSASMGLGYWMSTMLTGLVSTMLSLAPSIIGWLFRSARRAFMLVLVFILFAFAVAGSLTPVYAQAEISEQAIYQLAYNFGMEVNQPEKDDVHAGYWANIKARGSNYSYTHTVGVVDVSARYGKNGGEIWVQDMKSEWAGCALTEENFYGLSAYSFLCRDSSGYMEGFFWGMDNWGLATVNYMEDLEIPSAELADDLYYIMLNLTGSSAKQPPTITPTVTKPAAQPANPQSQGGAWTQEDINQMSIGVLEDFAREKGWPIRPRCTQFPCESEPGLPGVTIFEATNHELVTRLLSGTTGDPKMKDIILSGQGSLYRVSNSIEYDERQRPVYMFVQVLYLPNAKYLEEHFVSVRNSNLDAYYVDSRQVVLQDEDINFHGINAFYWRQAVHITTNPNLGTKESYPDRSETFAWIQYPWYFSISGHQQQNIGKPHTTDIPLFDSKTDPEILYLLAAQAGMFNPPSAQPAPAQPVPEQPDSAPAQPSENIPPVISEDDLSDLSEDELLGLLSALGPAALLPALGVAGITTLLDLLRRRSELPPGMVKSPIFGYGPVTPEAAAYQRKLLAQGYRYDPKTGKLSIPKVASPVDGALVSPAQAAHERNLLSQGYVWSQEYGFKTRAELNSLRANLDGQRSYVQSGQAHRDMQKAAQQEARNSPEHLKNQELMRQSRQREMQIKINELNDLQQMWNNHYQSQIEYWDNWSTAAAWTGIAAGAVVTGLGVAVTGLAAAAGSTMPAAVQAAGFVLRGKTIAAAYPFITATTSGVAEGVFNNLGLWGTAEKVTTENAKALLDKIIGDKLLKPVSKFITKGFSGPIRNILGHGTPDDIIQPLAEGIAEGIADLLYNGAQQVSGAGDYAKDAIEKKFVAPVFNNPFSLSSWGPGSLPNILFP